MENLKEIVAQVLECEKYELNDDSSYETIDNWDSFKMMQIVLSIEEEYNIKFEAKEMMELNNYGNIKRIVEEKLNGI